MWGPQAKVDWRAFQDSSDQFFFLVKPSIFSILGKMVQAPDGGENGENVNAGATESPAQSGTEGKIVPDLEPWS